MNRYPGRLRAVIFDLDGTLVDTADEFVVVVQALRAEHGLEPMDTGRIRQTVREGRDQMRALLLSWLLPLALLGVFWYFMMRRLSGAAGGGGLGLPVGGVVAVGGRVDPGQGAAEAVGRATADVQCDAPAPRAYASALPGFVHLRLEPARTDWPLGQASW